MSQKITEIEKWVVKDHTGNVIARFSTQSRAIDFANQEQKKQRAIVLIDITRCQIELLIRLEERSEAAS